MSSRPNLTGWRVRRFRRTCCRRAEGREVSIRTIAIRERKNCCETVQPSLSLLAYAYWEMHVYGTQDTPSRWQDISATPDDDLTYVTARMRRITMECCAQCADKSDGTFGTHSRCKVHKIPLERRILIGPLATPDTAVVGFRFVFSWVPGPRGAGLGVLVIL